jgi:hypothetical protein
MRSTVSRPGIGERIGTRLRGAAKLTHVNASALIGVIRDVGKAELARTIFNPVIGVGGVGAAGAAEGHFAGVGDCTISPSQCSTARALPSNTDAA